MEFIREKDPEHQVFKPKWPVCLKAGEVYEFPCDDKGREGACWLRVTIAEDGDVHVWMQEWEDIKLEGSSPHPLPSVRCRTYQGGGKHLRTHQALLWLAEAIRLDNEEIKGVR